MAERSLASQLRSQVDHFKQRERRAQERASRESSGRQHFAVLGLRTSLTQHVIVEQDGDAVAALRPVHEPPGLVELAGAIREPELLASVGRYMSALRFEITVKPLHADSMQSAFDLAWWIVSAIRTKTCATLAIVAVADHSWSTLSAIKDQTCNIQLLEDYPRARAFGEATEVTHDDLIWVESHLTEFVTLLEEPRFRFAVEALATHHLSGDGRTACATLWAGIESVFAVEIELRFRIAAYVACVLEPPGPSRLTLYREVKNRYDVRSRIVHGGPVPDAEVIIQVEGTRALLSRLLCTFTETASVPTREAFDELLFGLH